MTTYGYPYKIGLEDIWALYKIVYLIVNIFTSEYFVYYLLVK